MIRARMAYILAPWKCWRNSSSQSRSLFQPKTARASPSSSKRVLIHIYIYHGGTKVPRTYLGSQKTTPMHWTRPSSGTPALSSSWRHRTEIPGNHGVTRFSLDLAGRSGGRGGRGEGWGACRMHHEGILVFGLQGEIGTRRERL